MKNWNKYLFNFLLYGLQELTPTYELQKLTPTVVEAATIVANTFDILVDKFDEFAFLKDSTYQEKYTLIKMVLDPCKYNLAVMPKEIDELVDNMREIISNGINDALVYDVENDI